MMKDLVSNGACKSPTLRHNQIGHVVSLKYLEPQIPKQWSSSSSVWMTKRQSDKVAKPIDNALLFALVEDYTSFQWIIYSTCLLPLPRSRNLSMYVSCEFDDFCILTHFDIRVLQGKWAHLSYSSILNKHPYSNGVWLDVNLRTDTNKTSLCSKEIGPRAGSRLLNSHHNGGYPYDHSIRKNFHSDNIQASKSRLKKLTHLLTGKFGICESFCTSCVFSNATWNRTCRAKSVPFKTQLL